MKRKYPHIKKYQHNLRSLFITFINLKKRKQTSKTAVSSWLNYCFTYRREGIDKYGCDVNSLAYFYYDWTIKKEIIKKPVFNEENIQEKIIITNKGDISFLIAENKNSHNWVIGLHGWTENKYLGLRLLNDFYVDGYNIISFDSFAHGQSYGKKTDVGYSALTMIDAIIGFLKNNYDVNKIGLIGNSMGASTSILYAQKGTNKNIISWVVADCGFADLLAQIRYRIEINENKSWKLVAYHLNKRFKKETQLNLKRYTLYKTMHKAKKIPIFFIHPIGDTFVNYEHSLLMYNKKIKAEKLTISQIWTPEGSEHVRAISTYQDIYFTKIKEFIDSLHLS